MSNRPRALTVFLAAPMAFLGIFLVIPLVLTVVVSFWTRTGVQIRPALSLNSYTEFFTGVRLLVLERSLLTAVQATLVSLLVAYPLAYLLAFKIRPAVARTLLFLFTVPFLINYIIRTFAWSYLLGRTGPVNGLLIAAGITRTPVDWLLYSEFAVLVGLVTSYMPFMIFPLWLALAFVDRRLIQASFMLGVSPLRSFLRITLPLSLPGIFAAAIFGFVGCFGESAVPIIVGGVGYQLIGNTITSTMDVLNYPLAAAISTVVLLAMAMLLLTWYMLFDIRSFLGVGVWRRA